MPSLSFARRLLPRNRFVRSVSLLVGGTAGAQLIMVAAAPLLTRLYAPQDFGLLAIFTAMLSLVSVVASLRYELAIPLPDDDREAAALMALCLLCVTAVASVCAIPVIGWRHEIAGLLHVPRLANYLFLVPLGAWFAGTYNVLSACAVRCKEFAPMAKTRVSQSLIGVSIQVACAPFGVVALLVGQMASQGAGIVSLFVRVVRKRPEMRSGLGLAALMQAARRYRNFPLFSSWGALFNTAGSQLPPVLFAALFGPTVAGIYTLANRVLSMPMQLLGQAIANVFLSDAAAAHREGRLSALAADVHSRLAHIGMPPILVLLIAGPDIFGIVFGNRWREAGVFAQWLAPWLYLVFVTSPLSSLFSVLDRQLAGMVFQGLLFGVRIAAIAIGAQIGDVMAAVSLFAAGSAVCWLGCLMWLLRASGAGWSAVWQPSVRALAWSAMLVSPLVAGALLPGNWLSGAVFLGAAFMLIAGRYAFLMRKAWQ